MTPVVKQPIPDDPANESRRSGRHGGVLARLQGGVDEDEDGDDDGDEGDANTAGRFL